MLVLGDATNRFDELLKQKNAFEFDEDILKVDRNLPKPKTETSHIEPEQIMLDSGIGNYFNIQSKKPIINKISYFSKYNRIIHI